MNKSTQTNNLPERMSAETNQRLPRAQLIQSAVPTISALASQSQYSLISIPPDYNEAVKPNRI